MIKVKNLTKIYHSGSLTCTALDNISIDFEDKGFVMVLGPSGCGKTTLLNVLGGLDNDYQGEILINDKSVSSFNDANFDSYRNQYVGFIFQNYYLIPHLTVYDNIALTLEMSSIETNVEEKVDSVLKIVGLLDKKDAYPKMLSGGQKQRVAIARALISSPYIVLADEPTGALDSKSAESIMELLKEISKTRLVVMVTHNKDFAYKYGTRVISMLDGKIVEDNFSQKEKKKEEIKELKKVKIPFLTSFKWGFKNLFNKKVRSALTIIAGSVGIIGMGLILSLTSGIYDYIGDAQGTSLGKYPVTVTSYPRTSSENNKDELIEYPDTDYIIVEKGDMVTQEHYNLFQNDFFTYLEGMDQNLYTIKDSNSYINFQVITNNEGKYEKISSSYFEQIVANEEFVNEQYDCLLGKVPTSLNELAIVVDTYNRIDASLLESLGFNIEEDKIYFSDLISDKEYRFIDNNDYYVKGDGDKYYVYGESHYQRLFDSSKTSLKIVGILREKENSKTPLYGPGILYTPAFTEFVKEKAGLSDIVKEQLECGETKDVFTGLPFETRISGNYSYSTTYQYEQRLVNIGYQEVVTQLYFYTDNFEDRLAILDYIDQYELDEDSPTIIRTYDYIELVTNEFSMLVSLFSNIMLVFAIVFISVSALLIGILIYISVIERRKEIGLLRSLGARKKDITMMFLLESSAIGICSGIIGIIGAALLNKPVSGVVKSMIAQYTTTMLSSTPVNIDNFRWWVAPVMLIISVIVTLIAGLIPAIKASKKDPIESLKEEV